MRRERGTRFGLVLAAGQVRYQLLLLARSPISTFTALVIPLMVLLALDTTTPETTTHAALGLRHADFLAAAMATFALLNACYVNTITSVVLAREEGVLKRLYGTPLPLWAYAVGRLAAAAVVGVAAVAVVLAVSTLFLDVHISGAGIAGVTAVVALGIVVFSLLGLAVSTLVPRSDTALPVAYGTLLPVAFVSSVFFPATAAPGWLQRAADAFPLAPIAKAAERAVTADSARPVTAGQLVVTLAWIAGAAALTAVAFRWEPGASALRLRRRGGR